MKDFIKQKINAIQTQTAQSYAELVSEISAKLSVVTEVVNGMPFIASAEKSANCQYDEKHYFVVPYKLSEHGIALHTMRCLPDGVPEINDLPKRRVFHFVDEHSEHQLKHLLLAQVEDTVKNQHQGQVSSLEKLANDIDKLDNKLTYGLLLVGGLSALVNPLLGASIAAKALLPSASGLLNKNGLRPIGEKLTQAQLKSQIDQAKTNVQRDFAAGNTLKIYNPILQELNLALNTNEAEHDPLFDFDLSALAISEEDGGSWRKLTITALAHLYADIINDPKKHQAAQLGPEDLRWLKVLFAEIDAG
ncbi:hypothetical protein DS2_12038 [Catenovulum agarivorans DS-2]|uniref:Uncharacterized protein n=1 Tax=Catenovulum agarivorans DS-2 TaxID=1328313 RepID=W7QC61_9ALTE|nr:hypothetical protein [Catenovulum agarivorans]EWH09561.1 hypothetical protein DS2_12038 [Catenovulum agarivorans DS-2]